MLIEITWICAQLMTAAVDALHAGRFGDTARFLEQGQACVEGREANDPIRINHRILLGSAYQWLGRLEDADALYAAIPIDENPADDERRVLTAKVLSSRGSLRTGESRWDEAEKFLERALQILNTPNLRGQRGYYQVQIQLGQVYLLKGEFPRAEPLLMSGILGLRQNPVAKFDSDRVIAESSLGRMYQLMKRDREAYPLLERSYAEARRDAPDHAVTAECAVNLAVWLRSQKEYARALPLLKVAEKIYGAADGKVHAGLFAVQLEYASIAFADGRLAASEQHLLRSIEILNIVYGKDTPLVADAKRFLASVYKKQKKTVEAKTLLEEADRLATVSSFRNSPVRR